MSRVSCVRILNKYSNICDRNSNYLFRTLCSKVGEEITEKPKYPPILDLSSKEGKKRKRQALFDKYQALHTVEEKLFAMNVPKYYGWNSLILKEGEYPYNMLPFVQHITRTHLLQGGADSFKKILINKDIKHYVEEMRPHLQEAILLELKGRRWQFSEEAAGTIKDSELQNLVASRIVHQINSVLLSHLSKDHSHLMDSIEDGETRVEAWWAVGGLAPSAETVSERNADKALSEAEREEAVEEWVQHAGRPCLQLRCRLPLPPVDSNQLAPDLPVPPPHHYHPTDTYGLSFERRFGTNLPGFWPGEEHEFGLLSYHLCGHLLDRPPSFGTADAGHTIASQAILSSFSWLHAQASYQGFSTFHELTYPLVTQSIVTDGKHFSFFLYQLNTVLFHSDWLEKNPRVNFCLQSPTQKLYQDIKGDKFIGWNDEVIENLLMFYLNEPQERKGVNMTPNLNEEEKYLADIEDDDRRVWLHNQFRHMYSNRPRHRPGYEIYDWERIYKVKFETRPMDARRRPFELDYNPTEDRKYYQHSPPYIRKSQRSKKKHWTCWRAKFAKTYYPDLGLD